MSDEGDRRYEEAALHWEGGRPLDAGRMLFEALPNDARPAWAARVLRLVLARTGAEERRNRPLYRLLRRTLGREPLGDREVALVLRVADDPAEWRSGHRAFQSLRRVTLRYEALERYGLLTGRGRTRAGVVALAELVAKVTYNATEPPGPFDADSGWWVSVILRGFVEKAWPGDEAFAQAAWEALCWREV